MRLFSILLLATLAACAGQTQQPVIEPGPVQPLERALTFGTEPVIAAKNTLKRRVDITVRGKSGRLNFITESTIDAIREAETTRLRIEATSKRLETKNIPDDEERALREQHTASEGEVLRVAIDHQSDSTKFSVSDGGVPFEYDADEIGPFYDLFDFVYHGGNTVRQGEEILRFNLADVFESAAEDGADISYSGRVAGTTDHNGRQAVLVSLLGSMVINGHLIQTTGAYYIDVRTGLVAGGEMAIQGFRTGDATFNVLVTEETLF